MKHYCVACGEEMPYQTQERYEQSGNYCGDCLNKANTLAGLRGKAAKELARLKAVDRALR